MRFIPTMPNRPIKYFLLLLLVHLVQACVWLDNLSYNEEKIAALMEEQQFREVLAVATERSARTDEPDKQAYWQQVIEQASDGAQQYQQEQSVRLKQMMRRNDWAEANRTVVTLKQKLPPSEDLNDLLEAFESERQRYVGALSRSLVKLEAKHLPQTLSLYERLFKAEPENSAALTRLQQERDKRDRLIQAMSLYARDAESQQEYGLALNYVRTIQRFDDSERVLAEVKRLRGLLAEQQKQLADAGQSAVLSSEQKQQLAQYGVALSKEQWLTAKQLLDAMLKERPSDGELLGQQTYLAEVFSREVERAKELGESYYSTGNIERALAIWRAALPMAPDDGQLNGNIERAQRILNKVKTLKQGQTF